MLTPIRIPDFFFNQIREAEERADRVYEAVIGLVTDNKDPNKLGRIKVKFPSLGGPDTSWWAPIAALGAGNDRGWWFLPELDDEVLVVFEHGDIRRPIVLGALWNGKDTPPESNSGSNPKRLIVSRQKSKITFDDEEGTITLEDGDGNGKIVISKENKITLEAPSGGDVCIFAPQAEIKIVANEFDMQGQQKASLQCKEDIKIGGDAAVTLKGGTMVQVYGSNVAINPGGVQAPQAVTLEATEIKDPLTSRATQTQAGAAAAAAGAPAADAAGGADGDAAAGGADEGGQGEGGAGAPGPPLPAAGSEPRFFDTPTWMRPRAPIGTKLRLPGTDFLDGFVLGRLMPRDNKADDKIPVPVLILEGPDRVEVRKEIQIKARTEPDTPGAYVWFDVNGDKLADGAALTFQGKKKSDEEADQPVECRFTSWMDGKLYKKSHPITVEDKPTLTLPINLSLDPSEVNAWLAANPMEVRVDDEVTPVNAVVEQSTGRVNVSFRVKPGDHSVVVTSGPANQPADRPKLRVVHFSAKVKVTEDKPARAVTSTKMGGGDVGPKDRPTRVGRAHSAKRMIRYGKDEPGGKGT